MVQDSRVQLVSRSRLPLLCTLAYSPIRAAWVKDLGVDELMGARE